MIKSASGQFVTFADGEELTLPIELTLFEQMGDWLLKLDATGKLYNLGPSCSRAKLILTANILLVDYWRATGKEDRPKRMENSA